MPKHKTHKGLAKRVKVSATGKVKRHRAGRSHLMSTKNAKRRRRLRASALAWGINAHDIRILVGG